MDNIGRIVSGADDFNDGFAFKSAPRLTSLGLQLRKLLPQNGFGNTCHGRSLMEFRTRVLGDVVAHVSLWLAR